MQKIHARKALTANGWESDVCLEIENGQISQISDDATQGGQIVDLLLPAPTNLHSHAFQRAMAGLTETRGPDPKDSFWTWRQVMYKFLSQLTAEDAQVIATQLYIEMLKAGYTRVAEFHYLHHEQSGDVYQPLSTMAKAIFESAQTSGIGLTMLPVLYRFSGFGPQPATEGQRRFINSTEQFNQLVTECFELSNQYSNANVGIAPHSLRAVDKPSLEQAVSHVRSLDDKAPIHIHIAEQVKEVDDCLAHYGKRPVQWLLDEVETDEYWCLIHATHIDETERRKMAELGVIAGICPTTEANLGDGIFPTTEFLEEDGVFAIGSDSHISVNAVEELRWLEYAQRLIKQQRAVLANSKSPSVGFNLWQKAAKGGAQSTNSNTGELAIGKQADLLVIDQTKLGLFANGNEHKLDSLIFASQHNMIKDVMVDGNWVIQDYKHLHEVVSAEKFTNLLMRLNS